MQVKRKINGIMEIEAPCNGSVTKLSLFLALKSFFV